MFYEGDPYPAADGIRQQRELLCGVENGRHKVRRTPGARRTVTGRDAFNCLDLAHVLPSGLVPDRRCAFCKARLSGKL